MVGFPDPPQIIIYNNLKKVSFQKNRKYQRLQFLFHFHHYFYDASLLARQLLFRKLHGLHWADHCCAQIPVLKTGILVNNYTSLSCRKSSKRQVKQSNKVTVVSARITEKPFQQPLKKLKVCSIQSYFI